MMNYIHIAIIILQFTVQCKREQKLSSLAEVGNHIKGTLNWHKIFCMQSFKILNYQYGKLKKNRMGEQLQLPVYPQLYENKLPTYLYQSFDETTLSAIGFLGATRQLCHCPTHVTLGNKVKYWFYKRKINCQTGMLDCLTAFTRIGKGTGVLEIGMIQIQFC